VTSYGKIQTVFSAAQGKARGPEAQASCPLVMLLFLRVTDLTVYR